jgi:hypothetical protein
VNNARSCIIQLAIAACVLAFQENGNWGTSKLPASAFLQVFTVTNTLLPKNRVTVEKLTVFQLVKYVIP